MNKKEEVIHLELTQYGKYKLSKGKMAPVYYAFFDDNVLYDSEYGGVEEEPQEAQGRINSTPQRKTQYTFVSLEKQVKELTALIRSMDVNIQDDELQNYKEREYIFPTPLGTSEISNDKYPAWQINFLKGEIEGIASFLERDQQIIKIAQVDMKPTYYETQVFSGVERDNLQSPISPQPGLDDIVFDDGSYVEVFGDCLLFSIDEFNTEFENENVKMEVFITETERTVVDGEVKIIEKLIPLSFLEKKSNIVNGILMDDEQEPQDISDVDLDTSFVQYWFDVFVDSEIDREVLCSNLPPGTVRGDVLRQDDYDCPELPMYQDRISRNTESLSLVPKKGDDC